MRWRAYSFQVQFSTATSVCVRNERRRDAITQRDYIHRDSVTGPVDLELLNLQPVCEAAKGRLLCQYCGSDIFALAAFCSVF